MADSTMPSGSGGQRSLWLDSRAVLAIMAVTFVAKLILASHYYGFLTGDDVEVVQAAAKYAFGFDYQPWSLRCLFHPALLVAPFVKALGGAGPSVDPIRVAWAASVPAILASTASIWMVFRLAQSLAAPRPTAVLASALYATHWLPLSYGSMPFPRPISTMFFLAALLGAVEPSRVRAFLGGALVAAAFAVRFSEGILSLPFLWFLWRRHRSPALLAFGVAGGLAGGGLFVGLVDAATWGRAFASLSEFFRIMYLHRTPGPWRADKPWFWYVTSVLQWAGPAAVILAVLSWSRAQARTALFFVAAVVAGYSVFAYKAYRYLQAAIPFLAIAMAFGCSRLLESERRWRRWAGGLVAALAVGWSAERTVSLMRDRSMDAVDAALRLRHRQARVVVVEQAWAYGGRLILGNRVEIRDLPPRSPLGLEPSVLQEADAASFYERDLSKSDLDVLREAGFQPAGRFDRFRKPVTVFERRSP
jgi:hypothetical protein